MTIPEYIENLNRLKRLALQRWGVMSAAEREIVEASFEWLVDNLEIKRGQVTVDEDLSRSMDEFVQAVVDIIGDNKAYKSNLKGFLQELDHIHANNKKFHNTTNKFDINIAGVTNVQRAVVDEIMEQYLGNGLNAHFVTPLRDNTFRNILAGANMREVKQVLQSYVLSGEDKSGKFHRYLNQTAQQAVDTYTGAINQELVKHFNFTGYIISGSLIETSSKQCVQAVEDSERGYLTFEEWEFILDIARNNPQARLIPGTTIKNLPINKLHWGCRHDFTPVVIKPAERKPNKQKLEDQEIAKQIHEARKRGQDSLKMNLDESGNFTPDREKLHNEIIDRVSEAGNLKKKVAYTLGGAPANGKSTLVESGKMGLPKGVVHVDPDQIKGMLPEYAYQSKRRVTDAASFSHEESSYLSKKIVDRAQKEQKAFLLDGVGDGTFEKMSEKINAYKKAGYQVKADYVTLDTDTSIKLARERAIKTGRLVPETYILEMNKEISILVPELLANNTFDELNLWDTNEQGNPRLILTQKNGVLKILNQELYNNFLKKGTRK